MYSGACCAKADAKMYMDSEKSMRYNGHSEERLLMQKNV